MNRLFRFASMIRIALAALLLFGWHSVAQAQVGGDPQRLAFSAALKQIEQLEANKNNTFKVAIHPNLIAIKAKYGMKALANTRVPANFGKLSVAQNARLRTVPRHLALNADTLPQDFDLRDEIKKKFPGKELPIQNQQSCGSCWVFGAIGAYEGNFLYQGTRGSAVDAAEQYPLSCLAAQGIGSCETGGWPADTLDFLIKKGTGARSDPAMKYLARDGRCDPNARIAFQAAEFGYVSPVDAPPDSDKNIPSRDQIKAAIFQYGAVTVAVNATDAMVAYQSGVFNFKEDGPINHAVALVGWKKLNDKGDVAWLLRNSWGTDWGENGYMWIQEGTNKVGFGAMWVNATGIAPPPQPPSPCPCPMPVAPNYNQEIRIRIDFWMSYPQYRFPK